MYASRTHLVSKNGKEIVQTCQLHQVLRQVHSNMMAHNGRDKMDKYMKIHTQSGNGREFKNSLMSLFCKNNGITQLRGAPRKLSTQGLMERNNQTVKENIGNILKEKKQIIRSLVLGSRGNCLQSEHCGMRSNKTNSL